MSDKNLTIDVITASGQKHQFDMPADKAMMFIMEIKGAELNNGKKWVDVFDYTEATKGQFLIDASTVESIQSR